MTAETNQRIWFHPPAFWSFTKEMPEHEINRLFDHVYRLAEIRDIEGLKQFGFISVSNAENPKPAEDESDS